MTMFLSRSAWGAQPPNRPSPDRPTTTHLFVHHSATAKPHDVEEAKAQWRAIQADHLQRPISPTNPTLWADIAYNIGVGCGAILEGRGWDVRGGGTGPGNKVPHSSGSWDTVSVSICVLGNYQTDTLDADTRASLVAALHEAHERYGDLTVMGDRDVNSTACCGNNLYPLIPQLWAEATGDDMALSDEDVKKVAEAVWSRMLDIEGTSATAANWIGFMYAEITRTEAQGGKLMKNIGDVIEQKAILADGGH